MRHALTSPRGGESARLVSAGDRRVLGAGRGVDPDRVTVQPGKAAAETASWYGAAHHGRVTASGARFNRHALTAAHRSLPFGTRLRVCRAGCVVVRVVDRGPFVRGRDLDLSYAAARAIGLTRVGVGRVGVERRPALPPGD